MKCNVLLLAAAIPAASCSGAGLDPELELARNQAKWEATGPSSYVYAVERLCFCAFFGAARVTVTDGAVTSVSWVAPDGQSVEPSPDLFPGVAGLFEILADAMARDAHSIDVTYDPVTGAPTEFFIDYVEHMADEELGMRITEPVIERSGA
jgi:hypothetical protein